MLFARRSSRDQENAGGRGYQPPTPGRQIQLARPIVSLAIFTALAVTLTALFYPVKPFAESRASVALPPGASDDGLGIQNSPAGPTTAADRDFVRRIRLAGLWELPSGNMAQVKSSNAAVKEAGQHLIDGHTALNTLDIQVAQALNIPLPTEPNDQQKGFLAEMTAASQGNAFDAKFANLLRRAHGKVLPVVAETRAKTLNPLVRDLADQADLIVRDHLAVLEETGLVNTSALSG